MTGYKIVNLSHMLEELGEDKTNNILSSFYCPQNKDVEDFLRRKAVTFSKQGWSMTHLVFASYKGDPVLVGYFTLANKYISIASKLMHKQSNTLRKRLNNFARYNAATKSYILVAPLIAQLGKNFQNGYNKLISGNELLDFACEKIGRAQIEVGGRYAYVECEDKPQLIDFYSRNGFCEFDCRALDADETDTLDGEYLVQMIRYIKSN